MKVFRFYIDDYEACSDYEYVCIDENRTAAQFEKDIKSCLNSAGYDYLVKLEKANDQFRNSEWIDMMETKLFKLGYSSLRVEATIGLFDPSLVFCSNCSQGRKNLNKTETRGKLLSSMVGRDLADRMYDYYKKQDDRLHKKHAK